MKSQPHSSLLSLPSPPLQLSSTTAGRQGGVWGWLEGDRSTSRCTHQHARQHALGLCSRQVPQASGRARVGPPGLGTSAHLPSGTSCFTVRLPPPTLVLYLRRVSCLGGAEERAAASSLQAAAPSALRCSRATQPRAIARLINCKVDRNAHRPSCQSRAPPPTFCPPASPPPPAASGAPRWPAWHGGAAGASLF